MADLGRKITCQECNTKFYDLGQSDAKCPRCGAEPEIEESVPTAKRPAKRPAAPRKTEVEEAEPLGDGDEAEELDLEDQEESDEESDL